MADLKKRFEKFKQSRFWAISKKVLIGLSFAFNAVILLLLLVGLSSCGARPTFAADFPSAGAPSTDIPPVSNPLGLSDDLGEAWYQVVVADSGTYYRLPNSVPGFDSFSFGYFDGSKFVSSNRPINVGVGGGTPSTFTAIDESPYKVTIPDMPGLPTWLDDGTTFYLDFVKGGGVQWSSTRSKYSILAYSIKFGLVTWPAVDGFAAGCYLISSDSVEYYPFPVASIGGNFTAARFNSGLFAPPVGVSLTSKGASGWNGTLHLTRMISREPSVGYQFYGFNTAQTSTIEPFSDLTSYLPTSASLVSPFKLEVSLFLPSSLHLNNPVATYYDWQGYGADLDEVYNDGYGSGYESGYNVGYGEGVEAGAASASPITTFSSLLSNAFDSISSILNLDLFGLSLGTWLFIPVTIGLVFVVLRIFNHG